MGMKTGFKIKIYTVFISYMANSIARVGPDKADKNYHKRGMSDIYSHTS